MSLLPHLPHSLLLLPHPHRHLPLPPKTLTLRRLRCSSSSSSPPPPPPPAETPSSTAELPIFPLPLVLFPGSILPLQIFEFRYRIMMHTLLHSDLRFGVLFSANSSDSTAIGCVAEVVKHEKLADDRFFLIAKGQERFRINRILRSKPYLVADVSWLEDRPPDDVTDLDLESLSSEVERLMRDVIRISNRLNGKKKTTTTTKMTRIEGGEGEEEEEEGEKEEMDLRRGQFPTMFSFFVGSTFEGAPREQQALLEMEDTGARLRRERETLRNTLNYLTAAAAVKDVFPSSSSSSSSS